jgi:hypothetical protein
MTEGLNIPQQTPADEGTTEAPPVEETTEGEAPPVEPEPELTSPTSNDVGEQTLTQADMAEAEPEAEADTSPGYETGQG